jgi:CheY-like chemotaxis protein
VRALVHCLPRPPTSQTRQDALQQSIESERACDLQESTEARKPFVLVVEADPDSRLHMNAILNGHYEVLTAATESDARSLRAAHVGEIEIILMDISLNGAENGLRLTKSLREQDARTDVPMACRHLRSRTAGEDACSV